MSGLDALTGLDDVARVVSPVADRFRSAGHRIFLVGGVVRDLLLASEHGTDLPDNDIDLTTDARPPEIKDILRPLAEVVWDQGERFGTIGARVAGRALEITTHRAEAYDPDSRKPVVSFGDDIADDLARRDFTINAAAIELPDGGLHDPHQGLADLRGRLLRTPLEAEVSFTDDPLRMLRAARFIARFDLVPIPDLVTAASDLAARLDIVSVERVSDELERLLAVVEPRSGFEFLAATGLVGHAVPSLAGLDPAALDRAVELASAPVGAANASVTADGVLVRRAGLLWSVRASLPGELRRLRYSRAETDRTVRLIEAVDGGLEADPDEPTVRRLAATVGVDGLVAAATLATNLVEVGEADRSQVRALVELIERLMAAEDLADLDGPLAGAEVMDLLGVEQGPDVGRALGHLRQLRIERGPLDPGEARAELLAWWQARS